MAGGVNPGLPRILGIDPGLRITGYAVIEVQHGAAALLDAGIIRGTARSMTERLAQLHAGLVEVLEEHHPAVMVVEQLYAHYAHPRTAILMAHARGALLLAAAEHTVPVVSYNATSIKKTITGSGRASKEQIQRTMQRELGLAQSPEPPDVADAIAAALCHYHLKLRRA